MSKKANPTSIGLFIVIGLALGVAGLVLFSSGRLFSKQSRFILYFDASLKGLNPGAPVKFRGVTIGSVAEVLINHNQASNDYTMPVIVQVDEKAAQAKSDKRVALGSKAFVDRAVQLGMRGKLDAESLVTGVLYVELEIHPNAPPPVFHQLQPEYPEIPTVPTEIEQLLAGLAHFDIRGISDKLNSVLTRLDATLAELNLGEISTGVTNLVTAAHRVLGSPDLTNSLHQLNQVLTDARSLVGRLDARVDPLADGVNATLNQAQKTLADLQGTIGRLSGMVDADAPLRTDLTLTLEQLSAAASAIADLAQFLQRNPNSLLTGRKSPETKP